LPKLLKLPCNIFFKKKVRFPPAEDYHNLAEDQLHYLKNLYCFVVAVSKKRSNLILLLEIFKKKKKKQRKTDAH